MSDSLKPKTSSSSPAKTMAELMAKSGSNFQVLTKGQLIEGTIKKLTPQEILMDIGAKGDALVIEFDRQNLDNLLSMLHVGDRVTASVISPESEEGFPVVSLRRMLDDTLFKKFDDLIKSDQAFEIDVVESARGGYFAQTHEGVKGFLPSSQVTDTTDLTGKKIMVKILEVDRPRKRIVFSQKAISYIMDQELLKKILKAGDKVEATVTNVTSYGLFVSIEKDGKQIEGFIHISEVSYEHVMNLTSKFAVGAKLTAEVIEVDNINKRVNLSIKRTLKDSFADIESKYKVEDKVSGTVAAIASRGVTLTIVEGVNGFIPTEKIPAASAYKAGDKVDALVTGFDKRRRVVLLSPILKAIPVGYR